MNIEFLIQALLTILRVYILFKVSFSLLICLLTLLGNLPCVTF